jgi:cytochrome c oxidase assembly protein subunit 15
VAVLLGIELAQGTVGFVQYFTDLPIVLVGFHMLGAALVSAGVTWVLLAVREPAAEAVGPEVGPAVRPAPSRPTSSRPGSR